MPTMLIKTAVLDGSVRETIQKDSIARALRVRLPFRLRLGTFRRLDIDPTGRFVFFCRNVLAMAPADKLPADRKFSRAEMDVINTDLLIVDFEPGITDDHLEELRNGEPSFPFVFAGDKDVEKILNRFLMACQEASDDWNQVNQIVPIRENDFYKAIVCEYRVLMSAPLKFDDKDSLYLLNDAIEEKREWPFTYFLKDIPEDRIAMIPALMAEHGEEVHREFAFLARMRMSDHDRRVALLMAVVALEGAHGRLLGWELESRLRGTPKLKRDITGRFLREQGFHVLNEITPELFLSDDERPSLETLSACKKGIEIRNAIMHAGIDSQGRYKMEKYTAKEIVDSFWAVLET